MKGQMQAKRPVQNLWGPQTHRGSQSLTSSFPQAPTGYSQRLGAGRRPEGAPFLVYRIKLWPPDFVKTNKSLKYHGKGKRTNRLIQDPDKNCRFSGRGRGKSHLSLREKQVFPFPTMSLALSNRRQESIAEGSAGLRNE